MQVRRKVFSLFDIRELIYVTYNTLLLPIMTKQRGCRQYCYIKFSIFEIKKAQTKIAWANY